MKKLLAGIISTALVFFFSLNAHAERTGNDLLRGCNAIIAQMENKQISNEDYILSIFWTGYISGFIDNGVIYEELTANKAFCIPTQGIENGQAAMIIAKYLKNNPDQLHESARSCIFLAMANTFKCQ